MRSSSWLPLDEVHEALFNGNKSISRASVYRCFLKHNINKVPEVEKEKAKEFKAHQPGYLHMDVTYMPKFNKVYIASSIDLVAIWNRHKFQLNSGLHPNNILQQEWKEFGQENFIFEILSEIKQDATKTVDYQKEAKQLEAMFIEELEPFDAKGYNTK